jgi:hypothetical protein
MAATAGRSPASPAAITSAPSRAGQTLGIPAISADQQVVSSGTTTGGRNFAINVKEYRFVKTYPAKTGCNRSQSGKPSHYPVRTRLPMLPGPRIPRISGMNTSIGRSGTRIAGDLPS